MNQDSNNGRDDRDEAQIEAFLDGQMNDEQRQSFEHHVAGDPRLQSSQEQSELITSSLKILYETTPGRLPLSAVQSAADSSSKRAGRPRTRWLRVVQAVSVVAGLILMVLVV